MGHSVKSSAQILDMGEPALPSSSILDLTESVDLKPQTPEKQNNAFKKGGSSEGYKKIIGLMGVSGGVGTSSLAIQMAYDIIRLGGKKPPSVALIDLDFESGACAAYLDVNAQLSHNDLNGDAERVDTALTKALFMKHKTGIHILATKNRLGGNDQVNPDTVLAILDKACDMFDVIILDIPRIWRPWNHAAIGAADHFALLTELTIPGIHKTRHQMESIESTVQHMAAPCEIIITKMERRTFKNEIRIQDAVKILNRPLTGAICIDSETTLSALNRGVPAGMVRPDGRYAKDTRNVLNFWKESERNFAQHIVK